MQIESVTLVIENKRGLNKNNLKDIFKVLEDKYGFELDYVLRADYEENDNIDIMESFDELYDNIDDNLYYYGTWERMDEIKDKESIFKRIDRFLNERKDISNKKVNLLVSANKHLFNDRGERIKTIIINRKNKLQSQEFFTDNLEDDDFDENSKTIPTNARKLDEEKGKTLTESEKKELETIANDINYTIIQKFKITKFNLNNPKKIVDILFNIADDATKKAFEAMERIGLEDIEKFIKKANIKIEEEKKLYEKLKNTEPIERKKYENQVLSKEEVDNLTPEKKLEEITARRSFLNNLIFDEKIEELRDGIVLNASENLFESIEINNIFFKVYSEMISIRTLELAMKEDKEGREYERVASRWGSIAKKNRELMDQALKL